MLLRLVLLCAAALAAAAEKRIIGEVERVDREPPLPGQGGDRTRYWGGSIRDASHVITAATAWSTRGLLPLIPDPQ